MLFVFVEFQLFTKQTPTILPKKRDFFAENKQSEHIFTWTRNLKYIFIFISLEF